MIGKGATPSFFAIANDNYTLTKFLFGYISQRHTKGGQSLSIPTFQM